jgi:type IV pilus assembly protein PilM
MLVEGGFEGRRVITCLPDQLVHLKTLRLPPGRSDPLNESVRREAQVLFPFDLNEARLQYLDAGQTRYGTDVRDEVIVAASGKREVDAFLRELDAAGLDVSALDLSACAAYRAAQWPCSDDREIHAVLHLGETVSHVILGKGEHLRFLKRISIGTADMNSAVSRRLGIDAGDAAQVRRRVTGGADAVASDRDAIRRTVWQACRATLETLAADVSVCLRYYGVSFRGRRPERLVVSGPEAGNRQLCSILSSVGLPQIQGASPLAGFDHLGAPSAESGSDSGGEWSVAAGLALKSVVRPAANDAPRIDSPVSAPVAALPLAGTAGLTTPPL